jgi:hypothetical protein
MSAAIPIRYLVRALTETPHKCTYDPPCDIKTDISVTYTLPDGTPVERPAPGDAYLGEDHRARYQCAWSNCDGRHLYVITPGDDGAHPWDVDGRASNCGSPDDKTHRCWVRHGDPTKPETLHVDKAGHTCSAGAGSIGVPGYHGFLHGGRLIEC